MIGVLPVHDMRLKIVIKVYLPAILLSGCGVKGPPTPYVEVYPEKKAVVAVPLASPSITPNLDNKTNPTKKKK